MPPTSGGMTIAAKRFMGDPWGHEVASPLEICPAEARLAGFDGI
jgi:hypothetical protein